MVAYAAARVIKASQQAAAAAQSSVPDSPTPCRPGRRARRACDAGACRVAGPAAAVRLAVAQLDREQLRRRAAARLRQPPNSAEGPSI